MPRVATFRPTGVGFCTHNRGGGKRCGRETDFKPDGVGRYSECPVHRERGMEKSRRRREAAGKMPRRRREAVTLSTGMMGSESHNEQNRSMWGTQGAQLSMLEASNGYGDPIPSGIPLQPPTRQSIATSINEFAPLPTNVFPPLPITRTTHATLNGASIPSPTQPEPFPNLEPFDDQPMLDNIPPEPPQLEPQPEPPIDPAAVEADNRAAIWQEHSDTMKQIKDDIDSMLATLWAKDTDPRDLQGMFATLKGEVRQTRMRLLP